MRKMLVLIAVFGFLLSAGTAIHAEEASVLFDFEDGLQGWDIPDWAYEKPDHVQQSLDVSDKYSSEGISSMEVEVDFPGGRWTGAVVEIMQFFDWSDYSQVACDIYIPSDAPEGLKAALILTVGDTWKWVEMSRSYNLEPGQWVTIVGDLKPGSLDWRRIEVTDAFRGDVRKIDIRVQSNNKPAYTGSIYIDNVRVINE
ncbi:MAG: glycan-binding surface protein [Candidatus Omnitrophota bacterium]